METYAKVRNVVTVGLVLAVLGMTSGKASAQLFGPLESWSSCSGSLCIDAPPQGPKGLDGSGGWGWNSTLNRPVTSLRVNKNAVLTVTALQPLASESLCDTGTITLTYSSYDFTYVSNGDTTASCSTTTFDRGGVVTCSYTDFAHTDKSDGFTFIPQHLNQNAFITATVDACGNQASETFPVSITLF
jgi:hypothetical protein